MPATNVNYPFPLTRLNPVYPGQMGVHGAWTETGLRTNPRGTVFYVDPAHPDAQDGQDGTDPTMPLATMARALALCSDNVEDVILVSSGIVESVTCTVDGVHIIGIQHGTMGIIWMPGVAGETCLTLGGQNCLIEGFWFVLDGASTGIDIQYGPSPTFCDYDVVRHCAFYGHDRGILLDCAYDVVIEDCIFISNEYGILGAGNSELRPHIYNNTFQENIYAIDMPDTDAAVIYGNRFYCEDAVDGVAATNRYINLGGSDHSLVSQNVLACLLPVGPPLNGDYNDTCSPGTSGAWCQNYCMDGPTTTNPT